MGRYEIAKILIEAGALLDGMFNDQGVSGTSLLAAVSKGEKKIVKLLIDAGSNVNKCAPEWFPPLVEATGEGHEDIFHMLIAAGADVNAVGVNGGNGSSNSIRKWKTCFRSGAVEKWRHC